jgi:uncharacterized protein (TIGR02300 family)
MPKAKLGTKRSCVSCGMRYYDLNKTPINCPSCKTEFDPESVIKTRKSRSVAKAANDDDESGADNQGAPANDDEADGNAVEGTAKSADNDLDEDLDYNEDEDEDVDDEASGLIRDDISADDELLSNIPGSDDE